MKTILLLSLIVLVSACSPQPPPKPDPSGPAGPVAVDVPTRDTDSRSRGAPPQSETRTPTQIAQAACTGPNGVWLCSAAKPLVLATAVSTPIIPPSWTIAQWYIDPANTTTCASNTNNGTSSTCGAPGSGIGPLSTYQELNAHRWGCLGNPLDCPRLRQITNITFLSSHSDNSDPVYAAVALEAGASLTIQGGPPTVVTSGVSLSNTTAKNRAAGSNSLLITTLGATGAVGQLLQNTTHASRAWAYKSLGGNSFDITQPLAAVTVPITTSAGYAPSEVDTWANSDSVNLLQPIKVNIAQVQANVTDGSTNFTNGLFLYQLTIYDPAGAGDDSAVLGGGVQMVECSSQRSMVFLPATTSGGANNNSANRTAINVLNQGGYGDGGVGGVGTRTVIWIGGALGTGLFGSVIYGRTIWDADFIMGSSVNVLGSLLMGFVYLDNQLFVNTFASVSNVGYGAGVIYGGGSNTINMQAQGHFSQTTTNTYVSTFTAPGLVTGIKLNGTAAGCSSSNANNPDVINCAITTTPAHLDAAQGTAGFGGYGFFPGGASVGNTN